MMWVSFMHYDTVCHIPGSADGTVRLWSWASSSASTRSSSTTTTDNQAQLQRSYGGKERATFGGHPEEVYALQFIVKGSAALPDSGDEGSSQDLERDTAAAPAATAAAAGTGRVYGSEWLVAGSGESLFLWDLRVGRMVHEAMPPPDGNTSSAAKATQQQLLQQRQQQERQQQQQHRQSSARDEEQGVAGDAGFPPYVFSLAVQQAPSSGAASRLLATACCDGVARLWELGASHLAFVGCVRVRQGRLYPSAEHHPRVQMFLLRRKTALEDHCQ